MISNSLQTIALGFSQIGTIQNFTVAMKANLQHVFEMPDESIANTTTYSNDDLSNFNQQNKNFGAIDLYLQRYKSQNCSAFDLDNLNCTNPINIKKDNYKVDFSLTKSSKYYQYESGNINFPYSGLNSNIINIEGYYYKIQTNSPTNFYTSMNNLIHSNFIDSWVENIIIIIPYYNINFKMYFLLRIFYENLEGELTRNGDIFIASVDESGGAIYGFAVAFAFLTMGSLFYGLIKKGNTQMSRSEELENRRNRLTGCKAFFNLFARCGKWLKRNFRLPKLLEALSNILIKLFAI